MQTLDIKKHMNFHINLKALRLTRGYTITQLAKISGVHPIALGRYEKGKHSPTLDTLLKLQGALKCSMTELVDPS